MAICGHLVGDYLLQNDWMAAGKKRSDGICALHAGLWTVAVVAAAGWWDPLAVGFLFITHYWQDRTNAVAWWMDAVGQKGFRTGPCAPWSAIVVDNVWHIVALVFAYRVVVA